MHFNRHFNLEGSHAFLSASNYHWVNYDVEKLDRVFMNAQAARHGSDLHELAHNLIRLGVNLPRTSATLNQYVNDSIGWRMTPEQVLFFSENCYGTADAVGFDKNKLRISDLKTGVTPSKVTQLEVYAALFCLEYGFKPAEIEIELRIYQSDEVNQFVGDADVVTHIMDKITTFDKRIKLLRMGVPL